MTVHRCYQSKLEENMIKPEQSAIPHRVKIFRVAGWVGTCAKWMNRAWTPDAWEHLWWWCWHWELLCIFMSPLSLLLLCISLLHRRATTLIPQSTALRSVNSSILSFSQRKTNYNTSRQHTQQFQHCIYKTSLWPSWPPFVIIFHSHFSRKCRPSEDSQAVIRLIPPRVRVCALMQCMVESFILSLYWHVLPSPYCAGYKLLRSEIFAYPHPTPATGWVRFPAHSQNT